MEFDDLILQEIYNSALKSNSTYVKKGWGCEIHIINHEKYCLKYLFFEKNKKFSLHYHKIKQECWHCLYGKFNAKLENKEFIFQTGDKLEIFPKQIHQLTAIEDSVIIEVSTKHFDNDSIRIEKGN